MKKLKLRGSNNSPVSPNVGDRAGTIIQGSGLEPQPEGISMVASLVYPKKVTALLSTNSAGAMPQRVMSRLSECIHAKCLEQCLGL